VIAVAAEKFGWSNDPLPEGRGRGFALANTRTTPYLAIALEAEVDRDSGAIAISHVVAAVDCGEAVAPD
jgi:CO/xanthine dehydrogenase Mo-binding subunit